MTIKETIDWLKIMRVNLKNFPEISNRKKIEALTNAIDIAEAFEAFTDPNVSSRASYKTFNKVRTKVKGWYSLDSKEVLKRWKDEDKE